VWTQTSVMVSYHRYRQAASLQHSEWPSRPEKHRTPSALPNPFLAARESYIHTHAAQITNKHKHTLHSLITPLHVWNFWDH